MLVNITQAGIDCLLLGYFQLWMVSSNDYLMMVYVGLTQTTVAIFMVMLEHVTKCSDVVC